MDKLKIDTLPQEKQNKKGYLDEIEQVAKFVYIALLLTKLQYI